MTDYQNELVMEHLDLVNWVIRTRISVPNRPLLTYDDFYAIGCEAICRAALKYQADTIPDFPPRPAWEDLCVLAREDDIAAEVCNQELTVSWA